LSKTKKKRPGCAESGLKAGAIAHGYEHSSLFRSAAPIPAVVDVVTVLATLLVLVMTVSGNEEEEALAEAV